MVLTNLDDLAAADHWQGRIISIHFTYRIEPTGDFEKTERVAKDNQGQGQGLSDPAAMRGKRHKML
ncbi:hypothetical protein D0Y50_17205 [Salinimonas sediminis]|uniref:Uncharacterized protein n=1 Tax=Salinimonas sediminis TaxID=2303538 RepID=A0A346NQY3_9ALTE|nr:hypothetical protein D0Y50_17205 [Salinimonas sediminis]